MYSLLNDLIYVVMLSPGDSQTDFRVSPRVIQILHVTGCARVLARPRMRGPGIEPDGETVTSLRSVLRLAWFNSRSSHFLRTSVRRKVRGPGIEPGLLAWEANVLPLDHRRAMF